MGESSEWLKRFNENLNSGTKEISARKIRFLRLTRLKKMAEKIDEYSNTCRECVSFRNDLSRLVENKKNLTDPLVSGNTIYESTFGNVLRHLRKDHKLYPNSYFTSVYSLLGMLFGVLAGLLIGYMIIYIQSGNKDILKIGALLGWVIGLIIGQITGKRKDNEIREHGRQL